VITQGEYFTVRLEGSQGVASLLRYAAVRYREDAMAILEHLDARARLAGAFEPAHEPDRGFPGPLAAASTSRSTRFDNARQCVKDGVGRRHRKPGAAEMMASVRGVRNVSILAVALDPYTR
jgi:hypothetical protein